jgi:hypothetical protein
MTRLPSILLAAAVVVTRPFDWPTPAVAADPVENRASVAAPIPAAVPAGGVDSEPDAALPEELQRDIVGKKFKQLLLARRFAELEKWTDGYLKTGAKFPSGHYRIASTRREITPTFEKQMPHDEARNYLGLLEEWLRAFPQSNAARLAIALELVELSERLEEDGREPKEIEEQRRRATELLYDVEQADPTIPDLYGIGMLMARLAHWSDDLVDEYVERMLEHCDWCPVPLGQAYFWYAEHTEPGLARTRRIGEFFDRVKTRTRDRYGDALYAAILKDARYVPIDAPFRSHGVDWPRMRTSFEELVRLFPDSSRNRQQFCLYACANGDRATAARLFAELGDFQIDREAVWNDDDELRARRAWASPEFARGDQDALVEYPVNPIYAARWQPDGRRIWVGDIQGSLAAVDVATGAVEKLGRPTSRPPYRSRAAFDFSRQADRFVVGTGQGYVGSTTRGDYHQHYSFRYDDRTAVTAVATAPDGKSFATVDRAGMLRVHGVTDFGSREHPLRRIELGHFREIRFLGYTADSRGLVTVDVVGNVEVRNWETHEVEKTWKTGPACGSASLSPDSRKLATLGGQNKIRIWSVPGAVELATIDGHAAPLDAMAFSPDGRWFAVGEGRQGVIPSAVKLYDAKTGRLVRTLHGHKASITALDFSPDGKRLASAGLDMSIRLWDLP